jgi:serine protease Do
VRVGDWVLAVGHPFGLGLTVTAGIVGRRHGTLGIPGGQQYTGLLQTDAPINEGSSGGPLANLDGQVVGLNTAIYAPTGVFSGVGFAIPSNVIRDFLSRHLRTFRAALTARAASGRAG